MHNKLHTVLGAADVHENREHVPSANGGWLSPIFKKQQGEQMKYDAIVVGAGISGLLATLALSKEGKNVLLLEKEE